MTTKEFLERMEELDREAEKLDARTDLDPLRAIEEHAALMARYGDLQREMLPPGERAAAARYDEEVVKPTNAVLEQELEAAWGTLGPAAAVRIGRDMINEKFEELTRALAKAEARQKK